MHEGRSVRNRHAAARAHLHRRQRPVPHQLVQHRARHPKLTCRLRNGVQPNLTLVFDVAVSGGISGILDDTPTIRADDAPRATGSGRLQRRVTVGCRALNRAEAAHGRPASSSLCGQKRPRWPIQPGLTSIALWRCPSGSRTSPATFVSTSCPRTRHPAVGVRRGWALYAGQDRVAQRGRTRHDSTAPPRPGRPGCLHLGKGLDGVQQGPTPSGAVQSKPALTRGNVHRRRSRSNPERGRRRVVRYSCVTHGGVVDERCQVL